MTDVRLSADVLDAYCADLLSAAGTPREIAIEVANHLVRADSSGHASHGVMHLPRYIADIQVGALHPAARPVVRRDAGAIAVVDGNRGFGQFAARVATELSIEKATQQGVAAVALTRTSHIGRLGHYTDLAAARGCAMIMTTAPIPGWQVAPPGAVEGVLGTNPIAIAFPAGIREPAFSMDFATSSIAGGKVWLALQRGEMLPDGVLRDRDGRPTRDPDWLEHGAIFSPFGGHKGYGLAVAIALLAGALTGGDPGHPDHDGGGTLLLTVHQDAFVEGAVVTAIADRELARIGAARTMEGSIVVLPGEPEAEARSRSAGSGICITRPTWDELLHLASTYGVDPWPIIESANRFAA